MLKPIPDARTMNEQPIQNIDCIDILGRRKDGGVDLVVVVSGPLENVADHLECVEAKIQTYIRELSSLEFLEQFQEDGISKQILLATEHSIDRAVLTLIDSLRRPAAEVGATLQIVTPDYFSR